MLRRSPGGRTRVDAGPGSVDSPSVPPTIVTTVPARYFPFTHDAGRFTMTAGLSPLTSDRFGNGDADGRLLQFDRRHREYVAAKNRAAGHGSSDSGEIDAGCSRATRRAAHGLLVDSLRQQGAADALTPGTRTLADLVMLVQEDLAIVERGDTDAESRLSYMHVSLPSRWSPLTKAGRSFAQVHRPVPMQLDGERYIADVIQRGARRQRFVWGLQFDSELDQHPRRHPPARFDPRRGIWLRVERQVLVGLPAVGAMLFLIRPYVTPMRLVVLDATRRRLLLSALRSMTDAQRRYKGLQRDFGTIVDHLQRLSPGR